MGHEVVPLWILDEWHWLASWVRLCSGSQLAGLLSSNQIVHQNCKGFDLLHSNNFATSKVIYPQYWNRSLSYPYEQQIFDVSAKQQTTWPFIRLPVAQVSQKRQIQHAWIYFGTGDCWHWRALDAWCETKQTFILVKSNISNILGTVGLDWISRVCVPRFAWLSPKRCFGESHFTMAGALRSCSGGSWVKVFKSWEWESRRKSLKLAYIPQSQEIVEYIIR